MRIGIRTGRVLAGMALLSSGAALSAASPAVADQPPRDADPWIVTVGDSYISGEAGRWAGNSNDSEEYADALGPSAYYDNADHTAETIERCHRSQSAEVYIGGGVNGLNLACSGAAATTYTSDDGYFKPGLDFYDDGAGHQGQAAMLQSFAADHPVTMVAVAIGGNDFDFGGIITQCVIDFLTSSYLDPDYCNDDSSVTANFTRANIATVRGHLVTALRNVRTAMRNAGYADNDWTLVAQTYPSPLPHGDGFRYSERGFTRQSTGGCGFWNADADWANDVALPLINKTVKKAVRKSGIARTETLNLSHALDGRRLCENTVGLYEEEGLTSWTQPGAVDKTEWVNQIRITADGDPYYLQESLHPNYWAQLAERSCLRQVYDDGAIRGGTCKIAGNGLVGGEPRMRLR